MQRSMTGNLVQKLQFFFNIFFQNFKLQFCFRVQFLQLLRSLVLGSNKFNFSSLIGDNWYNFFYNKNNKRGDYSSYHYQEPIPAQQVNKPIKYFRGPPDKLS